MEGRKGERGREEMEGRDEKLAFRLVTHDMTSYQRSGDGLVAYEMSLYRSLLRWMSSEMASSWTLTARKNKKTKNTAKIEVGHKSPRSCSVEL